MTHLHESFDPAVIAFQRDVLVEALEAIRDYSPEESRDGTGPYTQIAMFAKSTARAALAKIGGDV